MMEAYAVPLAFAVHFWTDILTGARDRIQRIFGGFAYARRKPGISLEQAQADVKRVAAIVAGTDPKRYEFYTANAAALRESEFGLRAPLLILLGGAGLLLLIACANVATLRNTLATCIVSRSICRVGPGRSFHLLSGVACTSSVLQANR